MTSKRNPLGLQAKASAQGSEAPSKALGARVGETLVLGQDSLGLKLVIKLFRRFLFLVIIMCFKKAFGLSMGLLDFLVLGFWKANRRKPHPCGSPNSTWSQ